MTSINQTISGKPFMTEPIDRVVELYNSLFLTIRENKNTLTQWISNIFNKVEKVEDRVSDIENQLDEMKRDILIEIRTELREELLMEVREEMRA